MSASFAVQQAIRAALVGSPPLMSLVPAANILDRHRLPAPVPSIIIGEDQELEGDDIDRRNVRVVSTLHVWVKEDSLEGVKAIAGAIRAAMGCGRLHPVDGFHFADCRVSSARFLRDPEGDRSHAVVTIETLTHEVRA